MSYLFLFTITPVQDFISQSRKLKDLFGSSEILSCMSEIGMKICKREGGEIIFPHYDEKNPQKSYPNRFLVQFDEKSEDDLRGVAKEIEDNLLRYLKRLNNLNHLKIEEHLENYFTFYWAFNEIKDDNYKKAFDEVEKLLAGTKNTRFFTQLGNRDGERGRKCSICGERNVVVYNGKLPMPKEQIEKEKPLKNKIAQKGEGLCGVCYAKRVNSSQKKFESTADIALLHIFKEIKPNQFKLLSQNSQLFFKENINESYLKAQELLKENTLNEYFQEWEKFNKAIQKNDLKQTSYYGVIVFDGDSMGEWLSGKNLVDKNKLKEFHNFMSKNLIEFAKKSRDIVKEPLGLNVYAGGDDFLGFFNLNFIFKILIDLKQNWEKIVNKPFKNSFDVKKDFTFSAGVVIAHYKTPLSYVLNKAKEAEKEAKNFDNQRKNTITFMVLKRSGEIRKASIGFEDLEKIALIQEKIKDKSDSFIAKLEREFNLVNNPDRYLVMTELKRLLKKSEIEDIELFKIFEEIFSNFYTFSHLLNFLKFINRETK